jgi:hypothetical protein
LDPQTKLSSSEDQDLDSFMKSYLADGAQPSGELMKPGSYVQFFVEPLVPAVASHPTTRDFSPLQPNLSISSWKPTSSVASELFVTRNAFGAVSFQGIYLASAGDGEVCTKLDNSPAEVSIYAEILKPAS